MKKGNKRKKASLKFQVPLLLFFVFEIAILHAKLNFDWRIWLALKNKVNNRCSYLRACAWDEEVVVAVVVEEE